ncbi:MAG: hypothetical protein ACO3NI_17495, partial [bacterium]
ASLRYSVYESVGHASMGSKAREERLVETLRRICSQICSVPSATWMQFPPIQVVVTTPFCLLARALSSLGLPISTP